MEASVLACLTIVVTKNMYNIKEPKHDLVNSVVVHICGETKNTLIFCHPAEVEGETSLIGIRLFNILNQVNSVFSKDD